LTGLGNGDSLAVNHGIFAALSEAAWREG